MPVDGLVNLAANIVGGLGGIFAPPPPPPQEPDPAGDIG
jgi:hypothetical protein